VRMTLARQPVRLQLPGLASQTYNIKTRFGSLQNGEEMVMN
jgi:hypothetical protein